MKTYTAIDPFNLGRTVVIFVYIQIATETAMALSYAYAATPAGGFVGPEGYSASDLFVGLSSVFYLMAYIVGGIIALVWVYRVNCNAHTFVKGLSNTPPWAVGWFFVPIAALWKPYQAMSEAWQASERPQRWRTAPTPPYFALWWGVWLASGVLGSISNIASRATDKLGDLAPLMILGAITSITADVLFIRIVKGLSSLQRTQIHFGVFDGDTADAGPQGPARFEDPAPRSIVR